ncbi:MAG: glycosyltransferase, partial [bacterium]
MSVMRILLSGGGTLGPVTPLLALAEHLKDGNDFFWIGTADGPERGLVEAAGIRFASVPAGKIRRYADVRNVTDPFKNVAGTAAALSLIGEFKPDVHVTAGGFVSVPVAAAGKLRGVPLVVHQQDIEPIRSNLVMARFAAAVTASCDGAAQGFARSKPDIVGNPVRKFLRDAAAARPLSPGSPPTVLVLGGGTGALGLNRRITAALERLTKFCQIMHVTGGKTDGVGVGLAPTQTGDRYRAVTFMRNELADAYCAADLVISRAGWGVLSELAVFKKPTLLVPLPDSPQEANARYVVGQNAAELLAEHACTVQLLTRVVR